MHFKGRLGMAISPNDQPATQTLLGTPSMTGPAFGLMAGSDHPAPAAGPDAHFADHPLTDERRGQVDRATTLMPGNKPQNREMLATLAVQDPRQFADLSASLDRAATQKNMTADGTLIAMPLNATLIVRNARQSQAAATARASPGMTHSGLQTPTRVAAVGGAPGGPQPGGIEPEPTGGSPRSTTKNEAPKPAAILQNHVEAGPVDKNGQRGTQFTLKTRKPNNPNEIEATSFIAFDAVPNDKTAPSGPGLTPQSAHRSHIASLRNDASGGAAATKTAAADHTATITGTGGAKQGSAFAGRMMSVSPA
jgi:hypothetical protein